MLRQLLRQGTTVRMLLNDITLAQKYGALRVMPVTAAVQQQKRFYAKGKDKKREQKKPTKVEINEEFLRNYVNIDSIIQQMQKSLDVMKDEYIKNVSLRSTTGSIESLIVTVDGKEHELQELAQIIRKDPKTVVINMINFPQTIPDVLTAIRKSGMNLNPQQDGTTLFIPVPKVTKEHREGLAKNAKALFIKCRDSVKDAQNNAIKKLKKTEKVPEDDMYSCQAQITALADKTIAEAQILLDTKQAELLGKS